MPNSENNGQSNYLKVEAINIYKTLLDTNQLSVIRGSSHIIKNAVNHIYDEEQLEIITLGGSIGIFLVKAGIDPKQIKTTIEKKLTEHPLYHLFTFSIDTTQASSYLEAKEKLIALGRLHQMQHLTYPIPQPLTQREQGICAYNGFLPGYEKSRLPGSNNFIASPSVVTRFNEGRSLRSDMYRRELSNEPNSNEPSNIPNYRFDTYQFSDNLEQLAGAHPNIMLSGKVAVIYVDGNGFSKAQRKLLLDAKGNPQDEIKNQKKFDEELRNSRSEYLQSLLSFLVENKAVLQDDDKQIIQLETLLWGGDEMTIVVPAWIGCKTLQHFFKSFKDFSICGEPLTHAAGIVFCRASTPISKSQQLAIELADQVKETPNGRNHNLFDYAVLESVDYMTDKSLTTFWQTQYLDLAKQRHPLHIDTCAQLENFSEHLEVLPRSAIYHLVKLLIEYPVTQLNTLANITQEQRTNAKPINLTLSPDTSEHLNQLTEHVNIEYSDLLKRIQTQNKNILTLFEKLLSHSQHDTELKHTSPIFWLHLLELYDYLDPKNPNSEQDTTQEVSHERA